MKRFFFILHAFCLVMHFPSLLHAQDNFYDVNKVQEIRVNFGFSNWDFRMDTAMAGSEGYILAQSCTINGVQFDSVGVKYKGNSSYNVNNAKNPLHIELDWKKGSQDYQGYSDIKLSNCASDPSYIREVLSYRILGNYMHCPQSNFAKVFINGAYYGVMANTENVGRRFVNKHFFSKDNTFIKCNPLSAGPGSSSTSSLEYLGVDSSLYFSRYQMENPGGWADLVDFCNILNNNASQVGAKVDVDRTLWMHAFNMALVNLDSYHGAFSQNYYLYKDNQGLFNPVVWDLNESFGTFSALGGGGPGGQLSLSQKQNLSPTTHSTNTTRPLISKLLAIPRYKKIYLAHLKTIMSEMIAGNRYLAMADSLQNVADSAVQADQNGFFTYAQFQSSINTTITSGFRQIPGIQVLMASRNSYLSTTPEFTASAPLLSGEQHSPLQPVYNQSFSISVSAANASEVFLGYRHGLEEHFVLKQMFDDGLHNDGAAGDGVFGTSVVPQHVIIQYYFIAENTAAAALLPARAEHEFFNLPVSVSGVLPGQLRLNEILAINQSGEQDENGSYEDWIEVINSGDSSLNLHGLYLSDDRSLLLKWPFPQGTNLSPGGFLSVWADNDISSTALHANFKLSGSGEGLYLSNSLGEILDSLIFGVQNEDVSIARCPDGSGSFAPNPLPTKAAPNNCETALSHLKILAKPDAWFSAENKLEVRSQTPFSAVRLLDYTGRELNSWSGYPITSLQIQTSIELPGLLIVQIPGQGSIRLLRP